MNSPQRLCSGLAWALCALLLITGASGAERETPQPSATDKLPAAKLEKLAALYLKLGQTDEVARVAAPLAVSLAHTLVRSWPFAAGRGAEIAHRLSRTEGAALAGDPVHAREWLQPLREREDLRRFRLPCLACESGTVGIESVEEVDPAQ